ncbi:MAG: hypothetical protein LBP63_07405 [Prevotellaceae bacterium]|nr:hypothetical protein [Prevotellaceae bacterium]
MNKNAFFVIAIVLVIILLLPLCWSSCKNITIDWVTFTEEWYKTFFSSFLSTVLFGFVVYIFIESWHNTTNQHEIETLINKQKEIATQILSRCNQINIKAFLSNHNQIISKQPYYLIGIINGQKIIEQMLFFIKTNKNHILMEAAKKDIIEFCENFKSE